MKTEPPKPAPEKVKSSTLSWKDRGLYKPPTTSVRPKAEEFLKIKSKGVSC